jgi:hypothetical protein
LRKFYHSGLFAPLILARSGDRVGLKEFAMTRKSASQPNTIPGQRPALEADEDTVAIPRMADEFTGGEAFAPPKSDRKGRKKS